MKNLKKFAALLLAGAMALLMLTACGGGGSVNNPEEQKVLNHISNQKGVHVTSDAQLRRVAEEHLREDLEGALQLGNHKFFTKVHVEGEQEEYLTVTVTMPTSTFCLGIEHHLEYVFPSYILVTTLTYIIYKL